MAATPEPSASSSSASTNAPTTTILQTAPQQLRAERVPSIDPVAMGFKTIPFDKAKIDGEFNAAVKALKEKKSEGWDSDNDPSIHIVFRYCSFP